MREEILGVAFDPVTMDEAVSRALDLMTARSGAYVCTPNPEIVMLARRDPELRKAIRDAAIVLPDGIGIIWAAEKLRQNIPQRVAGYDFLVSLLERMEGSVFLFGGKPGTAEKAMDTIRARFPHVNVAGCHDGYTGDEAEIVSAIESAHPALLLVCLGAPKQEKWMAAHRTLSVGLMVGLGGSIDILAGTVRRAPLWWRERGIEWLYRLIRQPWRIRRQRCLPGFVSAVIAQQKKLYKRKN